MSSEIEAAKALIAHNVEVIAARDATIKDLNDEVRVLKGQLHMANEDYEMASAERNDLRAKLAAQPAAGVDKVEAKRCVEAAARSYNDGDTQSAVAWAIDAIAALAGGKA